MNASPARFLNVAAWPLTIWPSLMQFDKHAADDYVERTFPIIASAVAFWIGAIALAILAQPVVTHFVTDIGGEQMSGIITRTPGNIVGVLWFFVPVIYLVGFWLFSSRDEAFPG